MKKFDVNDLQTNDVVIIKRGFVYIIYGLDKYNRDNALGYRSEGFSTVHFKNGDSWDIEYVYRPTGANSMFHLMNKMVVHGNESQEVKNVLNSGCFFTMVYKERNVAVMSVNKLCEKLEADEVEIIDHSGVRFTFRASQE